jgi:hypothetical protein
MPTINLGCTVGFVVVGFMLVWALSDKHRNPEIKIANIFILIVFGFSYLKNYCLE